MSGQPEVLSDDDDEGFDNAARTKGRDNDFDDFDDEFSASTANAAGAGADNERGNPLNDSQVVQNRPYDEALELDDDEQSHPSPPAGMGRPPIAEGGARSMGAPTGSDGGDGADEGVVKNQPFDEAMELSSEESVEDVLNPRAKHAADPGGRRSDVPPRASVGDDDEGGEYGDEVEPRFSGTGRQQQQQRQPPSQQQQQQQHGADGQEDDEDEDEDDGHVGAHREVTAGDADGGDEPEIAPGMYNPAEYENLNVSSEIKELFQYIGRYKPHNIELETKMKPFIPDYIPAVGEIDPFVKVPRPDAQPDSLGLTVLDEPTSNQSDPVVMQLQLRAITKASSHAPVLVRSIESADKDPKAIRAWIDSIKELHRNKPQPSVTYSKPMPEVDELMQVRARRACGALSRAARSAGRHVDHAPLLCPPMTRRVLGASDLARRV